ncbi:SDR family NAD(P)-dependent oxidoreductase [Sodalis sp. RH21]|uniref:SDR family NAD(P)-dependent oxidoreductase n=1 Tax=unclassified Sodalis (in: enterobacteria) TaxID=2636512 RepID=UPI0039B4C0AD
MSKVWLITGSARGLGRSVAEAVLASGQRLAATARATDKLADLQARYGEQLLIIPLDVTDAVGAQRAVDRTVAAFGRLDVLVNNAGYGHLAPFEQMSAEDFQGQIDTNFAGVVNLCRAAVPYLRQQGEGYIFNISSVGGRIGMPGMSAYQAAKWAVSGFSEVLAGELAPVGVHVTSVEPGGMRTDWAQIAGGRMPALLADYEPSVGQIVTMLAGHTGNEASSPERVAQVLLRLAQHPAPPAHLLLGSDALHFFEQIDGQRAEEARVWREVSLSTDIAAAGQSPDFPVGTPS